MDNLQSILSDIRQGFEAYRHHAAEKQKRQLEADIRRVRPSAFCPDYVAYFVSPAVILTEDDIEDMQRKTMSVSSSGSSPERELLRYTLETTSEKMRNLQNDTFHDAVNVISLGGDCLPRNVLAKWGMKLPRLFGENSMPFDLAVHPFESTIEILNNDFSDYLADDNLKFCPQRNFPIHVKYNIDWNHETGSEWADSGFGKFKELYDRRIQTFRGALNDGKLSLLVIHVPGRFSSQELKALAEAATALSQRFANKITVLCLATGTISLPLMGAAFQRISCDGATLHVAAVSMPPPPYVWHLAKSYGTTEGLNFEKSVIQAVYRTAADMIGEAETCAAGKN